MATSSRQGLRSAGLLRLLAILAVAPLALALVLAALWLFSPDRPVRAQDEKPPGNRPRASVSINQVDYQIKISYSSVLVGVYFVTVGLEERSSDGSFTGVDSTTMHNPSTSGFFYFSNNLRAGRTYRGYLDECIEDPIEFLDCARFRSGTLRYRPPPTPTPAPTIDISGLVSSIESGQSDEFSVKASHLNAATTYDIRISSNHSSIGFNDSCIGSENTQPFSGNSSFATTSILMACNTPGGTVTASLRKGSNTIDSDSESVTVEPPMPTITVTANKTSVTEGDPVEFNFAASSTPISDLTVTVKFETTGSFLKNSPPTEITIAGGTTSTPLSLATNQDNVDERGGIVTVEITSDTGYRIGSPSSATVVVLDDDKPLKPTGLRANGHLVGGNVTLRWYPVAGVTTYNVRFVEEKCYSNGLCEPDGGASSPNWKSPPGPSGLETTGSAVKEAMLGGLSTAILYRVEVRAVIVDASEWSDFVLVYPTEVPRLRYTTIGLIELQSFQNSGQFNYVICNPSSSTLPSPGSGSTPLASPLPSRVTVGQIKTAIEAWGKSVIWNNAAGANIVNAHGVSVTTCVAPDDRSHSRNQVMFYDAKQVEIFCKNPDAVACWPFPGILSSPPSPQSMVLKDSLTWTATGSGGCTRLHEVLVHESGHSFGLFHAFPKVAESVMREEYMHSKQICNPTPYDVAAMMTTYQSR